MLSKTKSDMDDYSIEMFNLRNLLNEIQTENN